MKAVVDLVNKEVTLPNKGCVDVYPSTPHYCIMAERLVSFIASPFYVIASLYDTWQLPNILQVQCMNVTTPSLSNCNQEEMTEIKKFKDYTANVLTQVQEMRDWTRSVWAISCPFHGN